MAEERKGKERLERVEGSGVSRSWRARREVAAVDVGLGREFEMGALEAWRN